jgi:hypothetical protein
MGGGGAVMPLAERANICWRWKSERKIKERRVGGRRKRKKEKASPTFGPIDAAQAYMCVWWYSEVRYIYMLNIS